MGTFENNRKSEKYFPLSQTFEDNNEINKCMPFFPDENYNDKELYINDFQNQRDKEILENMENGILKLICKSAGTPEEKDNFSNCKIVNDLNESKLSFQAEEAETKKEKEENKNENIEIIKISKKSTEDNTNVSQININRIIFDVKEERKIELRIDYSIKHIKVYISKFMKNYGNELIKKCNFPNIYKNIKLFSPSYYYFTGNSNIKDNTSFLEFTVEQILTYPEKKSEKKDNRLQRQNKEIINEIKKYIEANYPNEVPDRFQELLNFFKMSYEDIINLFYNSNYFKVYSSSLKTRKLDGQFIKAKGFSLTENNGFIKLVKKYENN